MKISGFSFARNADTLNYPIVESIKSILPICDEFVIAIGKGDAEDRTRDMVCAIGDSKIRIIDTEWTDIERLKGYIYSQQTNIALKQCAGDWCFYIQCDEVVHEKYLAYIKQRCEKYLGDTRVEGFLFQYKHFWGDYDHYFANHKWYPREVRIIRNQCDIESVGDAQSFRRKDKKLRVIQLDAEVFHYGYVRHPLRMQTRNKRVVAIYCGKQKTDEIFRNKGELFDYGSLEKVPVYTGTNPAVLRDRIQMMDWKRHLQYTGTSTIKHDHDRFINRILTFLEQKVFHGRQPWGYKNYIRIG